jgi:transcription elongation factor S-II
MIATDFRANIVTKFTDTLNTNSATMNQVEEWIYENAVECATEMNIVSEWTNPAFVSLYQNKLRSLFTNVIAKRIVIDQVTREMICGDIRTMDQARWDNMAVEKKKKDDGLYEINIESSSSDFTCRKHNCKSSRCSYYQMQTRCADEPITTFVTCLDCGSRYRC